jgi:hypothetical protein
VNCDFIFWLWSYGYEVISSVFEVGWVIWKWSFFGTVHEKLMSHESTMEIWNCTIWLWIMPISSFPGLEISALSTRKCQYSVMWIPLNCWVWGFDINTLSSHQNQLLEGIHSCVCKASLVSVMCVIYPTGKFDLAWLNCLCVPITYLTSTIKLCYTWSQQSLTFCS